MESSFREIIVDRVVTERSEGVFDVSGTMCFGSALVGPPSRLHGGFHGVVRTLPVLGALAAHDDESTYPCALDVRIGKGLPLDEPVPFSARYAGGVDGADGWRLTTQLLGTDRLHAEARALPADAGMSAQELARWAAFFEDQQPPTGRYKVHEVKHLFTDDALWCAWDPGQDAGSGNEHDRLRQRAGDFGATFLGSQLDTIGASCRSTPTLHPHFTTRIELTLYTGSLPTDRELVVVADIRRTAPVEDSGMAPVQGEHALLGTVRTPVGVFDRDFTTAYATAWVTAHPVDTSKYAGAAGMKALYKEI